MEAPQKMQFANFLTTTNELQQLSRDKKIALNYKTLKNFTQRFVRFFLSCRSPAAATLPDFVLMFAISFCFLPMLASIQTVQKLFRSLFEFTD